LALNEKFESLSVGTPIDSRLRHKKSMDGEAIPEKPPEIDPNFSLPLHLTTYYIFPTYVLEPDIIRHYL